MTPGSGDPGTGTVDEEAGSAGPAPYVTPLVRKLAAEHSVDLSTITRVRRRRPHPQAGRACRRGGREARSRAGAGAGAERARRGARGVDLGRGSGGPGRPRGPARGGRPAAGHHGQAAAPASGHRPADDRVAADVGTAHDRAGGRHHPRRAPARPREGRLRAPRGRQAHLPAVLREGGDRGAQEVPRAERVDRRRRRRRSLPRQRPPGDRRGHPPRPPRAGDQERRGPQHRRAGQADRRRRGAHPRRQDRPRRAVRRHVHDHQHRQRRRAVRHADHQPAAGGDPRHRRDQQAAEGDRGRRTASR